MAKFKIKPEVWIDDQHFVGTASKKVKRSLDGGKTWEEKEFVEACYGWSKGASFMIYTIDDGHIRKIGTIKRASLLDTPSENV